MTSFCEPRPAVIGSATQALIQRTYDSYNDSMVDTQQADALKEFVGLLAPVGTEVAPMNDPQDLAAVSSGLPAGAIDWAIEVSHRCSDTVAVMMGPEVAAVLEAEARTTIELSTLSLLRYLTGLSEVFKLEAGQISAADEMARRGLPYQQFMAGQRRVQDIVLESLLDCAAPVRPGLLHTLTSVVSRFYDKSVTAIIEEYLAERQRALAQAVNDRRRVTRALIAGERVPLDLATRALGIDLTRHHLALVIWPLDPETAAGPERDLGLLAKQAADALRAPKPLTVPDDSGTDALLCWMTSPVPFPADHINILSALFAAIDDVRVAVGPPGSGAAGFRRSHLGARDAERVARTAQRGRVTSYRDVGTVALMSGNQEYARWFVTEELGPLAARDDTATADLRSTALCYLDCGRSLVRTAAALHVHRNTVVYRLQNVERLLGRSLDERPFATHAALTLADRLGAIVLE